RRRGRAGADRAALAAGGRRLARRAAGRASDPGRRRGAPPCRGSSDKGSRGRGRRRRRSRASLRQRIRGCGRCGRRRGGCRAGGSRRGAAPARRRPARAGSNGRSKSEPRFNCDRRVRVRQGRTYNGNALVKPRWRRSWFPYVAVLVAVAAVVGILRLIPSIDSGAVAPVLLLTVLITARTWGTGPALVASASASLAFSYYF